MIIDPFSVIRFVLFSMSAPHDWGNISVNACRVTLYKLVVQQSGFQYREILLFIQKSRGIEYAEIQQLQQVPSVYASFKGYKNCNEYLAHMRP